MKLIDDALRIIQSLNQRPQRVVIVESANEPAARAQEIDDPQIITRPQQGGGESSAESLVRQLELFIYQNSSEIKLCTVLGFGGSLLLYSPLLRNTFIIGAGLFAYRQYQQQEGSHHLVVQNQRPNPDIVDTQAPGAHITQPNV